MDVIIQREGVNLRFAPQASKGTREDYAVVILVKLTAARLLSARLSMAKAFS